MLYSILVLTSSAVQATAFDTARKDTTHKLDLQSYVYNAVMHAVLLWSW